MNKTNLIVDFSNIAMRALFTCAYSGEGNVSTFDTDGECEFLVRKISLDLAYVARIFSPDRIIIACDARHPWRSNLYSPDDQEGYKGTRTKDNTKNWDKIYRHLDELKKILKEKNFVVTEIPTAEGDDVAALWRKNCFDNNDSVVLVSSDKDWTQLIDFNKANSKFCICFNPISNNKAQKKLYCTQDFMDWLNTSNSTDIFFTNYNGRKEELRSVKSKDSKIEYEVINPNKVLLEKIFCGDDGDNAPSFYQYYKNGKKTRITAKKAQKICEDLNISNVNDLCGCCSANALKPKIESILKKELDDVDIDERLVRQRKLVELNPDLFPDDINSAFEYHLKSNEDKGYMQTRNLKIDDILRGTKYFSEDYNRPKENEIFKSLKELDNIISQSKELF